MTRAAAAVLAVLLLTGCTESEPDSGIGTSGEIRTFWATSVDGRKVPCITWSGYRQGGLSCDWAAK